MLGAGTRSRLYSPLSALAPINVGIIILVIVAGPA